MERPATNEILKKLEEIAPDLLDVTSVQISRALAGKPGVRKEIREKILEAAGLLGWTPQQSSGHVGFVVPSLGYPAYAAYMDFAKIAAKQRGFRLTVQDSGGDPAAEQEIVDHFTDQGFDAVVLLSPRSSETAVARWASQRPRRPIVVIDMHLSKAVKRSNLASVTVTNEEGAEAAVDELYFRGHRYIAYLDGPRDSRSNQARSTGYVRQMERRGLKPLIISGPPEPIARFQTGYDACQQLFERHAELYTAAIAYADVLAVGALKYAHDFGRTVGADFSIIGFDDLDLTKFTIPRLDTIRIPRGEQAEEAIRRISEMLASPGKDLGDMPPLPTPYLHRESVTDGPFEKRSRDDQYRAPN